MGTDTRFEIFRRGGVKPIGYLCAAAWNLREWQREVVSDPTLEPVLRYLLPFIRREVEINSIDAGYADLVAASLPSEDNLSTAALIAFIEGLELANGSRILVPHPSVPIPEESQWRTLARARAERIAIQWVNPDTDEPMVDWQNETDLAQIEKLDATLLSQLWDACEDVCQPKTEQSPNRPSNEIPSAHRSKAISKSKAASLLRGGNSDSAVEWLNQCIEDGTISCETLSRQSHVFDVRQFPDTVRDQLLPTAGKRR